MVFQDLFQTGFADCMQVGAEDERSVGVLVVLLVACETDELENWDGLLDTYLCHPIFI